MKIKTQDLTGAALDWAVAKCEGWDAPIFRNRTWAVPLYVATNGTGLHTYAPSTDWAQGGPIIEREKIDCVADPNGKDVWMGRLYATQLSGEKVIRAYGPTPLIAAMRALVWCKLGDEIDIPEGLSMIPSLQNPQSN